MKEIKLTETTIEKHVDFQNWEIGEIYDRGMWETDIGEAYGVVGGDRITIAANPHGEGKTLRYAMPAGGYNVFGSGGVLSSVESGMTEATLVHDLYFDSNGHEAYDWGLGGHLFGFSGGKLYDGSYPGGTNGDGFKARLAFRHLEGGFGKLEPYVYHTDQPGQYGDSFGASFGVLHSNRWHNLKMTVKLNDPGEGVGEGTGVFQTWLDGELLFERMNIRYRTGSFCEIDKVMADLFHGGNTPEFGPKQDQYVHVKNLALYGYHS